ncbi:MAG TPA: phosphoribosylformylglycinamidine cyclo-ligase [Gaiellales bacterium]|jgi:phosphoribosylformylglycinamidine cyclo-ligase
MSAREPLTYSQAGVSLEAADAVVGRLQRAVASTRTPRVLGDLGGFAGFVSAGGYRDPVLVAGTDGVGTKLMLQRATGRLRDSGVDLVAMCVNDVLTSGAEPVLFLDYIAVGRLDPERVADLVEGVADGCRQAGCALLGGETAELPDMYGADDLDLAGFALGIVERDGIVDSGRVAAGDAIVGLASSGVHSNGFTLVRRLLERAGAAPADAPGDLLAPTVIYAQAAAALRAACDVRAMAHITGGGLPGNLPRVLPEGLGARVDERLWPVPAVLPWLAQLGVERDEMRRVFNGGLGYVAIVPAGEVDAALAACAAAGYEAWRVGEIAAGTGVEYT